MLQSEAYVNPAFCQKSEFFHNNNNNTDGNELKISDDQQEELILDGRFSPKKLDGVVYTIDNNTVEFTKSPNSILTDYQILKPLNDNNNVVDSNHSPITINNNGHRYEYIDGEEDIYITPDDHNERKLIINANPKRLSNPEATRKLYEILNTPPVRKKPKIVQKLTYDTEPSTPKNTAIITPIRPTIVFKNEPKVPEFVKVSQHGSLTVASFLMIICGMLTSGLCLYMVTVVGRMYYLDFSLMSGFACLLLGILGFKSRKSTRSPHRNYVTGYVVLSTFSLITCTGLIVLLIEQPKPGSPLADITSGAICGISGLSIILASAGSVISFCCKYPPSDTRVQCSF